MIAILTSERNRQRLSAQFRAAQLRQLKAGLEDRVSERTTQLEAANADLSRQVAERTKLEEQLMQAIQQGTHPPSGQSGTLISIRDWVKARNTWK